jgi:hypothetical protein
MAAAWDDGVDYVAEDYSGHFAPVPVRQPPTRRAQRASVAGLLVSGVAIATLSKIGARARVLGGWGLEPDL